MSKCPYTNFKQKVMDYIGILRQPRKEYNNMPACPFIGKEIDQDKLMIDKFYPNICSLLEMVDKLEKSKYDSALFVQVTDDELLFKDTKKYQNFINVLLKRNNYKHLKCICFNPNDELDIDGFNIRSHSPYFLINIANKKILSKSHINLLKTKYFDNMNEKYLKYLNTKIKNK